MSKTRHKSIGKKEMWYVMQVEENARLILGFKEIITTKKYVSLLEEKK
ncbi:hypothetical protein [Lutibacter sp.]